MRRETVLLIPSFQPAPRQSSEKISNRIYLAGIRRTHVACVDQPGHLRGGGELAVDEALDLALGPPVVDVHDGEHEPPPRLELVLDAVLVALALHLHGGEDEAVAHKVGRVAHALGRLEAGKKCFVLLDLGYSCGGIPSVPPKI